MFKNRCAKRDVVVPLSPQTSDHAGKKCYIFMCFVRRHKGGEGGVQKWGAPTPCSTAPRSHATRVKISPLHGFQDPDDEEGV